jgi:hypothetical protein
MDWFFVSNHGRRRQSWWEVLDDGYWISTKLVTRFWCNSRMFEHLGILSLRKKGSHVLLIVLEIVSFNKGSDGIFLSIIWTQRGDYFYRKQCLQYCWAFWSYFINGLLHQLLLCAADISIMGFLTAKSAVCMVLHCVAPWSQLKLILKTSSSSWIRTC